MAMAGAELSCGALSQEGHVMCTGTSTNPIPIYSLAAVLECVFTCSTAIAALSHLVPTGSGRSWTVPHTNLDNYTLGSLKPSKFSGWKQPVGPALSLVGSGRPRRGNRWAFAVHWMLSVLRHCRCSRLPSATLRSPLQTWEGSRVL